PKELRGDMDWIAMKALEKDRTRRYETANALARDVQRFLADEVVEARPPSVSYRVRKFVRRHKGQVVAANVVLAAVLGGAGVSVWQAVLAKRAEDAATENAETATAEWNQAIEARDAEDEAKQKADGLAGS